MKQTFIVALTLFASLTQAADEEKLLVICRSTGINDAGYEISVTSGGFTGKTYAHVNEESYFGPRSLGTVAVNRQNHLDGVQFVDEATQGRQLNLSIDFTSSVGSNELRGYVKGLLNGNTIPPVDLPEAADLTCTTHE